MKTKFKAWDKEKKIFVKFNKDYNEDEIIIKYNGGMGYYKLTSPRYEEDDYEIDFVELKELELVEFTGLKDKKGEEIYKGDIVLIKTWMNIFKIKSEVIFEKGAFMANDENVSNWTDIEKIGNKFENPELLEEKKDESYTM